MFKSIIILATLLGYALAAVEFIELNDHNNNLLPLETSKAFKTVQDAVKNEFRFRSVKDAIKFVDRCKFLKRDLKDVADTEFEGLAGKIKAFIQDDLLVDLCSVHRGTLSKVFAVLDNGDMGVNLTRGRLNDMVELGSKLDADAKIKTLLKHLYEKIKNQMVNQLLKNAAQDTSIFFGEQKSSWLSLDDTYKSGCSVSHLAPICKLVRKTTADDVSALGSDVADFTAALASNDQTTLTKHVEMSGVSLDDLKSACGASDKNWLVMKNLDAYVDAHFIDETQIKEQAIVDANFYLYHELYKLCKVALSQ